MRTSKIKKVLVTGGAGFLGSHLCTYLLNQGHSVTRLDNFFTGKKENIASIKNHPKFALLIQDICDPINIFVEEIYNLACPASPLHYQKDPIGTLRTCILGCMNMLELACKNKAKILQASTSEIYGDPLVHPQKEDYAGNVNPIGIRACYDEGKRAAETLFFDYMRSFHLEIKVARIFNTYGPHMHEDDGRVISNFIAQALQEHPLTVYGDGSQTRSFCFVDDLIYGLVLLMQSDTSCVGPMNLGNPEEYAIHDLAHLILQLTGSKSSVAYLPLPKDDPKMRCPDIAFAKEKIHWSPKTKIQDGLRSTIEYFQTKLGRVVKS